MGFWWFMLVMILLIPITMLFIGRWFSKKAPNKINHVFGYRTAMSMKNRDTWEFAHKYVGKLWTVISLVMLPVSVIAMLLCMGKSTDTVGYVGGVVEIVQVVIMIGSIFPVEKALRRTFDKDGNRL